MMSAQEIDRAIRQVAAALALPGILVAAALAVVVQLPQELGAVAPTAFRLVAALAAGLAWRFRQGNVALSALSLLVADLILETAPDGHRAGSTAYAAVSMALPIALGFLILLRERGLMNRHGALRAALAGVPLLVAAAFLTPRLAETSILDGAILPPRLAALTPIPDASVIAFLIAGLVFLIQTFRRGSPLEAAQFGAFFAAFGALHLVDPTATSAMLAAGAALLAVGVLQNGYRVAFHDELTGLPARRALRTLCAGLAGDYAIAMLDVDFFKKFNDTFGHDVGDDVLRKVAATVARVGGGGRAFRYGGEEFTVVFPGKTALEAVPYLEEVRMAMESTPFVVRAPDRPKRKPKAGGKPKPPPGRRVQITISIGVAERSERHPDPDAVIKGADEALYRAKKKGRNQVSR